MLNALVNHSAAAAAAVPAQAHEASSVSLAGGGAAAIVVGLIVWAVFEWKHGKRETKKCLVLGFVIGSMTAGAAGLLGMGSQLAHSGVGSLASMLGGLG